MVDHHQRVLLSVLAEFMSMLRISVLLVFHWVIPRLQLFQLYRSKQLHWMWFYNDNRLQLFKLDRSEQLQLMWLCIEWHTSAHQIVQEGLTCPIDVVLQQQILQGCEQGKYSRNRLGSKHQCCKDHQKITTDSRTWHELAKWCYIWGSD